MATRQAHRPDRTIPRDLVGQRLPPVDVRSGRPYLLSRSGLTVAARRLASITALVAIDLRGLAPTAVVLAWLLISLLRASYDLLTADLFRVLGIKRHALLAGSGESLTRLHRALGSGRSGIDYEFVGAVAESSGGADLPVLGPLGALPQILASHRVDELIVTDSDFGDQELLEMVEQAHRRGVQVRIAAKATELLTHHAEFVPGQGVPLFELRPPAFVGADWILKRSFDLVVSSLVLGVGLPLWLAIAAAVKLTSSGPV